MPISRFGQFGEIKSGELNVGRLFVDTKQIYLDARANAAEFNEPRLRVDAMYAIVEMIGRFLREIRMLRLEITRGEVGLKGFDADLAGVQQRYRNLYQPFFEDLAPPAEWTNEQWKLFEDDLEGPILLWNLETCRERWGIPFGTPACEGPDLHMVLSLLHQTAAAEQVQAELIASAYGLADLTMQDFADTLTGAAKAVGRGVGKAFAAVRDTAEEYFLPTKTAKRLAWGVGIAIAVGGGGYLWLKTRKGN
jgi:hypothetical protein